VYAPYTDRSVTVEVFQRHRRLRAKAAWCESFVCDKIDLLYRMQSVISTQCIFGLVEVKPVVLVPVVVTS